MNFLSALLARWLTRDPAPQALSEEEAYLADAGDLHELEFRQRQWARGIRPTN